MMVDFRPLTEAIDLLFRDAEPGVLEHIRDMIADAPSGFLTEFLDQFIEPSYVPVDGTSQYVVGLSLSFPQRADQLLAALRAYQREKNLVGH